MISKRRTPYERRPCEAKAALDQPCRRKATVVVDGAPLCHDHARQAYDRKYSDVDRLPRVRKAIDVLTDEPKGGVRKLSDVMEGGNG